MSEDILPVTEQKWAVVKGSFYPTDYYITAVDIGAVGFWQREKDTEDGEQPRWVLTKEQANLISAAPDLYQATKMLAEQMQNHVELGGCNEYEKKLLRKASDAIAKAEGKE